MKYLGDNVIIMSCSRCNVSCEHCYVSYGGNRGSKELIQMTRELSKQYNVMLNGTEPLMNLEYLEAYQENSQDYILTNGLLLIKQYSIITDELKKHGIDKVSVSYHFDIHDIVSKIDKKEIEELFRKLNLDKFNARILTTISSQNYKNILEYCEKALDIGANAIKFTNFIKQGHATKMDDNFILTQEQKHAFFEQLNEARSKYSKDKLQIQRCGSFGKDTTRKDNKFKCTAGTNSVVITPNNMVYPCIFLAKNGNEIGRYSNGIIELFEEYKNDGTSCLASRICNENMER